MNSCKHGSSRATIKVHRTIKGHDRGKQRVKKIKKNVKSLDCHWNTRFQTEKFLHQNILPKLFCSILDLWFPFHFLRVSKYRKSIKVSKFWTWNLLYPGSDCFKRGSLVLGNEHSQRYPQRNVRPSSRVS